MLGKKHQKIEWMHWNKHRVVDLTRQLHPGRERFTLDISTFPVEDLLPQFKRPENEWYILQELKICSHIGTHIESPHHHLKEGNDISQIPLHKVMGDAVVLDCTGKAPGEQIEQQEFKDLQKKVRKGDIVLLHTGYDRMYNAPDYDRPHVSLDFIRWLVDRGISCLGIDASGLERYKAAEQPGHLMLFKAGIAVIEELTNLDKLKKERFFFMGLPLPLHGADSCPIRAIAVERK